MAGRGRAAAAARLPRVIPRAHWEVIAAGVGQRLKAINRFLLDLYQAARTSCPTPWSIPRSSAGKVRLATARPDPEDANDSLLDTVNGVAGWVHRNIRYRRGATAVTTTAYQVLRALGIPSRYVSGLLTGEVGETHAWVEVRHPRRGWLAADPTRGVLNPPPCDYVKLTTARYNATHVAPIEVIRGIGTVTLQRPRYPWRNSPGTN